MTDAVGALRLYDNAIGYITWAGLEAELNWQRDADISQLTESDLLRETAWVILCSGFRESVVRKVFNYVSLCFCEWESSKSILDAMPGCKLAALSVFNNHNKISAIVESAKLVHRVGFDNFKAGILSDPFGWLSQFPYIGPVTVWHLAKNLGLDAVKPDRHLLRISHALGFGDPDELCTQLAHATGEPVKVVDLVIWRYLADNPQRLQSYLSAL
jgi:hypothetical protein